tara:strand:- start:184 stop:462 length:279 start_codon:yes stop_codon:yes gene_type:complete
VPRFFGLTPSDKEAYLEQIFLLMYYMGFSYTEGYDLPIWQRTWFIKRINEEIKRSNEANAPASRAAHDNTAQQRAMQGRGRSDVPAKLRRFT